MDLSLNNIWRSWFKFKKGKQYNRKMHEFQYNLEKNLYTLFCDLNNCTYLHGGYENFTVSDNKKREISVCPIRDRIVHRLIYDHLTKIYDKTFIFDAWSCRKGKGLHKALKRARKFIALNPSAYIWKADIKKFFDNVSHEKLKSTLKLRVINERDFKLLESVIDSFGSKDKKGIPIGNLTSQIFSNIYLNELDRFIKHELKIKYYLRYGDDFIIISEQTDFLEKLKSGITSFVKNTLDLEINHKSEAIIKCKQGLRFLGMTITFTQINPNRRNKKRTLRRLTLQNVSSYHGMLKICTDKILSRILDHKMFEIWEEIAL